MVGLGADRVFAAGIEYYEIGVAAYCDRPLARIQTKELRRGCRNQFDESIHTETALADAARVKGTIRMLITSTAVRNLCKVVASQFFLFFETKWTVIRGDHLQMIALQSVPELFLMPLFAKGRGEYIFRTFKVGDVKVFD